MRGSQRCGTCNCWRQNSDASTNARTSDGRRNGRCQLEPKSVDKTESSWCSYWVADQPGTLDEAALAMCEAYKKGDITLALVLSDKLNELHSRFDKT